MALPGRSYLCSNGACAGTVCFDHNASEHSCSQGGDPSHMALVCLSCEASLLTIEARSHSCIFAPGFSAEFPLFPDMVDIQQEVQQVPALATYSCPSQFATGQSNVPSMVATSAPASCTAQLSTSHAVLASEVVTSDKSADTQTFTRSSVIKFAAKSPMSGQHKM